MASPFFSGRIPQELNDRINQHCAETGESKTQVLLNALSKYLDFPIKPPVTTGISTERFNQLEQRVAELEKKLEITNVSSIDNKLIRENETGDNSTDIVKQPDNNLVRENNPSDDSTNIVKQPDNIDNVDNQDIEPVNESQTQLSISGIEGQQVEADQGDRKPLILWVNKIIKTNEASNLPGLEEKDKRNAPQRLRTARFKGKTEVQIGRYLLRYYDKEEGNKGVKGSLLWEVITGR